MADSLVIAKVNFIDDKKNPQTFLGGVKLLNEPMALDKDENEYRLERKFLPPKAFTFNYQDDERDMIELTYPFNPPYLDLDGLLVSLNRKTVFTIMNTSNLENTEIGILIIDTNNKTAAHFYKEPSKNQKYPFPQQKLKALSPGIGQIYLVQKTTFQQQSEGFAHHLDFEFYSKPIQIDLRK